MKRRMRGFACLAVLIAATAASPQELRTASGDSGVLVISALGQCASGLPAVTQPVSAGITVAESVETPGLATLPGHADQPLVSPDGKTYALFVVHSDLARNGQWLDILIGSTPEPGKPAVAPRCLTSLFTDARRYVDIRGAHDHVVPTYPGAFVPVWLTDNRRLAFVWSSGPEASQLISVDTSTGQTSPLTRSADSIYRYIMSPDAKLIAYDITPQEDRDADAKLYQNGFAIRSLDADAFIRGYYAGVDPWDKRRWRLQAGDDARDAEGIRFSAGSSFSPDGRLVVTPGLAVAAPPESWRPFNISAEALSETRVFDLKSGRSWRLLDAPDPVWAPGRPRGMVWSPDGTRLLIGRTYIPGSAASPAGRAGEAIAVIDVSTGQLVELPVPDEYPGFTPMSWEKDGTLTLSNGRSRIRFEPVAAGWKFAGPAPAATAPHIEIFEDMNRPPVVVTDVVRGAPQVLLKIAPKLEAHRLGQVKIVDWTDRRGHAWRGRLYLPPGYMTGQRYPLVVQTHGAPGETEFSLTGGSYFATEAYSAQALATRGMAVLQTPDPDRAVIGSPEEPRQFVEMLTGAISRVVADGIADPEHIGLLGYSRSCWHVEYALIHSDLKIAAAVAANGMDASYVTGTLINRATGYSADNGGQPFGAGLAAWLERSPGFTLERIRSPLLLTYGGGSATAPFWELFSRMRLLKLPVELFLLPEYLAGEHPAQLPSQQYASQQRSVDWFDFWLNGHEDADPAKREQYEGWRDLKTQRDAVSRTVRPPLLHWTATPIPEEAATLEKTR